MRYSSTAVEFPMQTLKWQDLVTLFTWKTSGARVGIYASRRPAPFGKPPRRRHRGNQRRVTPTGRAVVPTMAAPWGERSRRRLKAAASCGGSCRPRPPL